MTVNSLHEFVDKVNKDLGDFCTEFAYKRKELAMLGKAPSRSVLFKYSDDGRDWCINEGGHTEIQFHLYLRENELGYGLGFNTQYTPFANEKSPEEYMRPFAEAYLKLKPSHWTKWTSTGLSWIEGDGDTLFKNLERDNYVLFGRIIRISDNQIDNSSYNILLQDIKGVMCDMYKDIFAEVKRNKEREMESTRIFNNYKEILVSNHNLILTGAPGTGKTYLAKQIAAQMIMSEEYSGELENDSTFKSHVGFTQFHPSYDYTDFVEGLRPTKEANGFVRTDGIFKAFCKEAIGKNDGKPYIFIIDEINRGEISKIFGELFFSVDPGYRGKAGKVKTQYQNMIEGGDVFKDGFYVPENVYIIGTMNDIDRSVESMDFAFRRRFAFMEIKAMENTAMLDTLDEDIKNAVLNRMKHLNYIIWHKEKDNEPQDRQSIEGLSSAYHIGASYFLKLKNYDGDFNSLWSFHIEGVLREYLRGMEDLEENIERLKNAFDDDTDTDY